MVYAVLTPKQRDRLERELSLDFAYSVPGRSRFRVNVYYQRATLGAAFRIIPYELKGIAELGMPDTVSELARIQRGLVLVTGPTGSGKSTTLAAMVDIVNSERRSHIMTVEDPIEFLHKHKRSVVSQREVGSDAHSFADALKHVLRQDPDVILVGEMRDLETISTAITAAETGHLVFATLHTQDSPQTIDRIIDVFPPYQQQQVRVQLSATLQGVVCQQLLPRAEGGGRVAASEILVVNPAVRNLIREGKTHQIYAIMQSGRQFGMRLMDASLAELVASRQISREVAIQHSHSPEDLNRLLQSISPAFASGSGFPPQAQSFNGGGAQ
jgi:twitching motility protein PilT